MLFCTGRTEYIPLYFSSAPISSIAFSLTLDPLSYTFRRPFLNRWIDVETVQELTIYIEVEIKDMSNKEDLALMAHLFRRIGFGASREELDEYLDDGYEQTVEGLLNTSPVSPVDDALIRRYHPDHSTTHDTSGAGSYLLYRLVATKSPLIEKMAFFWSNIFATGYAKVTNGKPLSDQFRTYRTYGMGRLDDLLLQLSRDPAMIIWLDNIDNHNNAINENYGRELLELFSMGVGNYTEDDIKECSRAFTGWTIANADYIKELAVRNSIFPYGKLAWDYEYNEDDHDSGIKTFLGETGNFNGEDIIRIICEQPATARFIARHIYHFFVADEPPVPQWPYEDPKDIEAIEMLEKAYFDSDHNIKEMLRVLLLSKFFKSEKCRFAKVKSPVELVTGVLKLTEEFPGPNIKITERNQQISFMGQTLFNPPSVEGWHQGLEWIETGSLTERVNFASEQLGDNTKVGIKKIVRKVTEDEDAYISSEAYVDRCLEQLGALEASPPIRETLIKYADENGLADINLSNDGPEAERKVYSLLSVIGFMPEFQRC